MTNYSVSAKLRVEVIDINSNTHFYGNSVSKKVIEETIDCEFDKREDIAPNGVNATIEIGNKTFHISINRFFFDYESSNHYVAFFTIDDNVYELYVEFDDYCKINDLWLSEWLSYGYFEDGDDADNVYHLEDFKKYDIY